MKLQFSNITTRLSIPILTITITLFVVSFAVYYKYSSKSIIKEAIERSENQAANLALKIEKKLNVIETAVDNSKFFIEALPENLDQYPKLLEFILKNNKDILAVSIALEPEYISGNAENKMPYRRRTQNGSEDLDLTQTDNYDYQNEKWYMLAKYEGKSYWCEPYKEHLNDFKGTPMVSYSSPLYKNNNNEEFIGAIIVDVPLDWLDELITTERPYPNSHSYLISKKGYFLAHKDRTKILSETIFEANTNFTTDSIYAIGKEILTGEKKMSEYTLNDTTYYEFYKIVRPVDWTVGMVSHRSDIISELIDTTQILVIIAIIGIFLIFTLIIFVIRRTTTHIKKLSASTKEIAKGNFNVELPKVQTHDEVHQLRESFVSMQHSLKEYVEELKSTTQNKQRIESELTIATQIQMGMLPTIFPPYDSLPEVNLFATLKAAKEVGGDLYDFLKVGDTLYFIIGDVSGKGVPASLLMTVTLILFRSAVVNIKGIEQVMKSMNNAVIEKNKTDMFITAFLGALNTKTGDLTYVNAGHNPPVIIRNGNAEFVKQTANLPLGVIENIEFKAHNMVITAKDTLFLYTDGVTEAENHQDELYSNQRLLELINSPSTNKAPEELIHTIHKSVNDFAQGNQQSDDITMLAIKLLKTTIPMLTISNKIEELDKVAEFIELIGNHNGLKHSLISSLNLALEEIISNIILYAFNENRTEAITIELKIDSEELEFIITDSGIGFDPTKAKAPDITNSIQERTIGGLGILITKKIMDKIEYNRTNNKNILTLTKQY